MTSPKFSLGKNFFSRRWNLGIQNFTNFGKIPHFNSGLGTGDSTGLKKPTRPFLGPIGHTPNFFSPKFRRTTVNPTWIGLDKNFPQNLLNAQRDRH